MNRKKLDGIMAIMSFLCSVSYYAEGDWLLGTAWCLGAFISVADFITD